MNLQKGKYYYVSECFSEHDIPGGLGRLGVGRRVPSAKELVEAVRSKVLKAEGISNTESSAWFCALLKDGSTYGVCIHKRHLSEVKVEEYEYEITASWKETRTSSHLARSQSEAMVEARKKWPRATEFRIRRISEAGPPDEHRVLRVSNLKGDVSPREDNSDVVTSRWVQSEQVEAKLVPSPDRKEKVWARPARAQLNQRDMVLIQCAACHGVYNPGDEFFQSTPFVFQLCQNCRKKYDIVGNFIDQDLAQQRLDQGSTYLRELKPTYETRSRMLSRYDFFWEWTGYVKPDPNLWEKKSESVGCRTCNDRGCYFCDVSYPPRP